MKILLDTNIIIHREASHIKNQDIGTLFNWLDRLHFVKCVHPLTIEEIRKHQDKQVVNTMEIKVKNYNLLKTESIETEEIRNIRNLYDSTDNDRIDTSLLKEVFYNRVDCLITEDRKIYTKAKVLGITDRIFTIDAFLEKVTAEYPEFTDYKVLSVKKEFFGNIDLNDPFFDSFKEDYIGFESWFNKKADNIAYICNSEDNRILAFLYLKIEETIENYYDINPTFIPKKRLKIGTFKVVLNGYKLGERFLKIIFDNALLYNVDEIYITIFNKRTEQQRLIFLLEDWGFKFHGKKTSSSGEEFVFVKIFSPLVNYDKPRETYPYISKSRKIFIVPIYPEYHTELLPDSILRTESPNNFIENKPNRNAISKVYISRSIERNFHSGDIIVFYRTKFRGSAYYTSVTTTIGIVEQVIQNISNELQFIRLCRKRSVFSDKELSLHWNYYKSNKPFIVNFLYVYSLPKRLNLKKLTELGILINAPRGFEEMSRDNFEKLLEESHATQNFIIN